MCFVAPATIADSPEFKELICTQGGYERTAQLCHRPRLHQFQPAIDTTPVAHAFRAKPPLLRIEEDEAQYRRVMGVTLFCGLQPLGEAQARRADYVQIVEQSIEIGASILVDLDTIVLDDDPVPGRLGMLIHHCLDGCHLPWLDQ